MTPVRLRPLDSRFTVQKKDQNDAGGYHSDAQELSHGKISEQKTYLRIGLPEKFNYKPEDSVKNEKKSDHHAVFKGFFSQTPQYDEKQQAFCQ
jgi:hypothetical protein